MVQTIPEIGYKRGFDKNYLIIRGDEETYEVYVNNYKLKMLAENNIDNLLKLSMKMNDGLYDYYYEISGMQPISRLFEHREIGEVDLKNIVCGVDKAFNNAYEYMLPMNHFMIDPKLIYMDIETGHIALIYYPQYEKAFEDSLMDLAEYILDKVNHQDANAVMMAYQLYKIVKTRTFTMQEVIKVFSGDKVGIDKVSIDKPGIDKPCAKKTIDLENDVENDYENDYGSNYENDQESNDVYEDNAIIKKSKQFIGGLFSFNKKKNYKEEDFDKENILDFNRNSRMELKEYGEEDTLVKNREYKEIEPEMYGKTMVLMPEKDISQHVLVMKSRGKEVIHELNKLPVTIGKVSKLVDIVVEDSSVSKLHAEIFQEGDQIYIKDCSSTNGTYVNGLQLDAEESITLEPGDEISLGKAKIEYR